MSRNERTIAADPGRVWDVLADGWLYPLWVVGASRVREVDASWPDEGARIHHSVGVWPALIDDTTVVLERRQQRYLRLQARGWPMGEAEVQITLEADGAGTRVIIEEDATSGPGRMVPKPLRTPPMAWRNTETLRRLAYVAEGRPL